MYEGAGGSGASGFRSRSNVTSGGSSEGKLIIANLDWGVSDSDISVRNIGEIASVIVLIFSHVINCVLKFIVSGFVFAGIVQRVWSVEKGCDTL